MELIVVLIATMVFMALSLIVLSINTKKNGG